MTKHRRKAFELVPDFLQDFKVFRLKGRRQLGHVVFKGALKCCQQLLRAGGIA